MARTPPLRDRLVKGLTALGCTVVETSRTGTTKLASGTPDRFYWVGTHGALRYGRTKTTALSVSGGARYNQILEKADAS